MQPFASVFVVHQEAPTHPAAPYAAVSVLLPSPPLRIFFECFRCFWPHKILLTLHYTFAQTRLFPPPQVQRALPAPLPAAHLWLSTTSALGLRICFECLYWPEPSTRGIPPHSLDARNRPPVQSLICGIFHPLRF